MPAGKRRLGVSAGAVTAAQAETLHASAAKAEAWLERLDTVRSDPLDAAGPEAAPAPDPAPAKRGLWPFGRPRKGAAALRVDAVMADLEEAAAGRPQASADLLAQRTPQGLDAGLEAPAQVRRAGDQPAALRPIGRPTR